MQLFIIAVFLLLFPCLCFSSKINTSELVLNNFKESLQKEFFLSIKTLARSSEEFAPLIDLPAEIYIHFLKGKQINERVLDQIIQFVNNRFANYGIDVLTSIILLEILHIACENTRKELIAAKLSVIESNRAAVKVLADICHLFKTPIQRLILTSKAYGYGEMFQDAPILLENIRNTFVFKTDPLLYFDFEEKLDFLSISFDFYFSQRESDYQDSLALYRTLKTEIMAQINSIIDGIKSNPMGFVMYSSGLGITPIIINLTPLDSEYATSNEDLWRFIMEKVNETREIFESECPDLNSLHEQSLIDAINNDLMEYCHSSEPFTNIKARMSIKKSSKNYFSLIKQSINYSETYNDQLEWANHIISDSILQFNTELATKVQEIGEKIQLSPEEILRFDFNIVAVSELVKDKVKYAELESYL